MDDDEWIPERLSALLGMQADDPPKNSAIRLSDAAAHLASTREISARRAAFIVENGRCDECSCELGQPVNPDECECPCHCNCCCPPLFHCLPQCECTCDCHCEANASDSESTAASERDASDSTATKEREANGTPMDDEAKKAEYDQDDIVGETPASQARNEESGVTKDADATNDEHESSAARGLPLGGANGPEEHDIDSGQAKTEQRASPRQQQGSRAESAAEKTTRDEKNPARASPMDLDGQASDDDMTGTAPIPRRLDQLRAHQVLALLAKNLPRQDDQAEANCHDLEAELFRQVYTDTLAGAKPAKTTNNHLPVLAPTEAKLLHEFLVTVLLELKYTATRTLAALKDISRAAARSTWTAERILTDRLASARLPREPPTNVWKQPDNNQQPQPRTVIESKYRFNPGVYTPAQVERYNAICMQEHVFGETTRDPTPDEWEIILGLASGAIQAAATPQFLMRCCTLDHIAWMFEQIQAAEGELWVRLPAAIKMFNYGQTTRRLAEAIRQSAAHQKWTDNRLDGMLAAVKSIAYSKQMHALHFYFFSKHDATSWENMPIPFRASQFKLVNPETKLRRSHHHNVAGLPTDDDDGLVNDRYQAQFQIRLLNLVRAISLRAIIAYLQRLTKNGLKSVIPLDTYGQYAEGSVMWDIYSLTATCPPELLNYYRIDWDGHPILLQHNPEAGQQPCLQCARMGHQTANCTTPEEEWNQTTLKVTAAEIRALTPTPQPWKTLDDVKAIFATLHAPTTTDPTTSTIATAPASDDTTDGKNADPTKADGTDSSPNIQHDNRDGTDTANKTETAAGNPGPTRQNEWKSTTDTKRKKKNQNKPPPGDPPTPQGTNQRSTPPAPANPGTTATNRSTSATSNSAANGTQRSHNTYIDLAGSDDESSDSDYEDEKDVDTDHRQPPHHETPKTRRQAEPPGREDEEADLIERAIWATRVEQVRSDIWAAAEGLTPEFPLEQVRDSIARARPNINGKTSIRWILEAINGRLTETPGTGNCQSYAFLEALTQRDLKEMEEPDSIIGAVIAFKYGLYAAYSASTNTDRKNTNAAQLLNRKDGLPSDITQEETHRLVQQHYRDLARSGSALNNTLEERLWGTLDTIRCGVLLVDAPVFLVTQTTEPMQCGLIACRKMKNARGETFVALSQPGVEGWLNELEDEAVKSNRAPIVLVHCHDHYDCVIFDRHQPANVRPATKKLKTPILSDLWNPPSLDTIIDNAKKTSKPQQRSARRDALNTDAKITTVDMISFLTDPAWSVSEKAEIAEILVSGATNFKELLTFSTTSDGPEDPSQSSHESMDAKSETSDYCPSASSEDGTGTSQAFSLPSQGDESYRRWADSLWEPVRDGWMEHNYVKLPALTNHSALREWIKQLPGELLDASRWCANPFAVLDHMTKEDIRTWMHPTWLKYCVTKLQPHVDAIKNQERRQFLRDWLDSIAKDDKLDHRLTRMKEEQPWAMLREELPQVCESPAAVQVLTKQLSLKGAYLLALHELFPDLARQALADSGWTGPTDSLDTTTAYAHAPAFAKALNRGVRCQPVGTKGVPRAQINTSTTAPLSNPLTIGPWLHSFFDQGQPPVAARTPGNYPKHSTYGILTQNVRGFKQHDHNQAAWMAGWKAKIDGKNVHCIAIQETHVSSSAEADELAVQWSRQWGRHHDELRPLSFWTVTTSKVGGVAILLHPRSLDDGWRLNRHEEDAGRCIIIETLNMRLANVYAPNKRGEREDFFTWLVGRLGVATKRTVMVGDFNCVLDNGVDRIVKGKWGPGRNESPQLQALIDHHQLRDVVTMAALPTTQIGDLTYWQGDSGARLDRGYVSRQDAAWVVGTEKVAPHQPTDHSGVVIWMRDPAIKTLSSPIAHTHYPIQGRDQDAIDREVGAAVGETIATATRLGVKWDGLVTMIKVALHKIRQGERRRARRQRKRRDYRARKNIQTLRDLIEYVRGRTERKNNVRRQANLLEKSGNSAQLFRRFVQIDQRRDVPTLDRTRTTLNDDATEADVMAQAWQPLLGHKHTTISAEERAAVCAALFTVPNQHRLADAAKIALLAPVTAEEVHSAIDGLGPHKAAGPDRLSNDFYKDWSDLIVPSLVKTFTEIMGGGPPPLSFAEAIIVPLPKSGDRSDALNYRPISLLQSGYKIFTKLLANRVQASLMTVINADQNGFVRGRALADNISIMQAILRQSQDESSPEPPNGAVILIDFRKAYDTIDRDFLRYALHAFGYPEAFINIVDNIHTGTSARFLVNGELSEAFDIVTGIRQGCPLAPLLFLIAAETLKHALDQDPQIRGIRLRGHHADHIHSFSAFVDDSVVYLQQHTMITALENLLATFATVSGLQAQPHKSHAIILAEDYTASRLGSFPVVPRGQTVTYLGLEMGIADLDAANWAKRMDKVTTRLGALSQYTTSIDDRVRVINLACVPSLLFTAQFFTPPSDAQHRLDGLWRQYIWHGTTVHDQRKAHKIARDILELPKSLGGMGLYDYRGATLKQAATNILRWNTRPHDKYWEAFHALLPRPTAQYLDPACRIYPTSDVTVPRPRLQSTAKTMTHAIRLVNVALSLAYQHPDHLRQLKQDLMQAWTTPWKSLRWQSTSSALIRIPASLLETWMATTTRCYAAMPPELRSFWATFPWTDNAWVTGEEGAALTQRRFPGITISTLADLNLRQLEPGLFSFRNPTRSPIGIRPSQVRKLAEWIRCIICNTPSLLGDIAVVQHRVYASHPIAPFDRFEWTLQPGGTLLGTPIAAKWQPAPTARAARPALSTTYRRWLDPRAMVNLLDTAEIDADIDRMKRHGPIAITGHPAMQHGPTLLPTLEIQPTERTALRQVVRTQIQPLLKQHVPGLRLLHLRLERALARQPQLSQALQSGPLNGLARRPPGVSAYQATFWYRLSIGGLNLRDQDGRLHACPHAFCTEQGEETLHHLLWDCGGARQFWGELVWKWAALRLGNDHETDAAFEAVFTRTAPTARRDLLLSLRSITENYALLHKSLAELWVVICTAAAQHLWLTRNETVFKELAISGEGVARRTWAAVISQLTALGARTGTGGDTEFRQRLASALPSVLSADAPTVPAPQARARLYFDGGSRGNPGPAGSGAVVVEQAASGQDWNVVWWTAHFVGEQATNNEAEHDALLRGIQECARRYAQRDILLTIIGDSELVLGHVAGHNRSTHQNTRRSTRLAQQVLRVLPFATLRHTLRSDNKMADWLANLAMNERRTTTSSTAWEATDAHLTTLLLADIEHATRPLTRPLQLLPQLSQQLLQADSRATANGRKRPHN